MIKLSENRAAEFVNVTLAIFITLFSFIYWPGKTNASWLPNLVFANGPEMSMATNSSWLEAENKHHFFRWQFLSTWAFYDTKPGTGA